MNSPDDRTQALLDERQKHVPRGLHTAHPIVVARAKGAELWDVDGNAFIDFVGGIGVMNVGHGHPRVVQAIEAQLERLMHTSVQVAAYEPYVRLAERLNAIVPVDGPAKTLLLSTGAEAVENAIKIARAATRRSGVIAFGFGFHGRTLLGLSLTGKVHPYRDHFGPLAPAVYHAPYPYAYRGVSARGALAGLERVFETEVAPDEVAAVIIEPVLGEGGFVPAPAEFLRELRRITSEHGIVLIADEIQSGFGRTGRMFAVEHAGVRPDVVTTAKSLAGGMPLSAVTGRAEIMDAPLPGGLGGTYGGNPLACAAALAVLDVFESEGLLERSQAMGNRIETVFRELAEGHPEIGDVRALGAMVGIELVDGSAERTPNGRLAARIVREARERGLLLLTAGSTGQVIRVLAPLTTSDGVLDRALDIFTQSFEAALEAEPSAAAAPAAGAGTSRGR
jgi:4-aminobutyrate aminotransferase / (S)-3-amino-2-methylpropionate transaminase / 5-aminovalerate transaminase